MLASIEDMLVRNFNLSPEIPIKTRFANVLSSFPTGRLVDINSIRKNCSELSEISKELLIKAEQIAIKNLEHKKIVRVPLIDGTPEGAFGYRLIDPMDVKKLKSEEVVVELTGKDYFITKSGSFGRGDDFLPYSDIDFIVFPTNEESIPYSSVLQIELTMVLKEEILKLELPITVDEILNSLDDFQIKLTDIPEKLFVLTKPEYWPEFGMTTTTECFIHSAFRDLEFISGNPDGFRNLQEIIDPALYPYSNTPTNQKGVELINALAGEVKSARDIDTTIDVKRNGLRLIQFYNWILRSKLGIKENSVFDSLDKAGKSGIITSNDSQDLSNYYSNLLQTRNAIGEAKRRQKANHWEIVMRDKQDPTKTQMTSALEPFVCGYLGVETNGFKASLQKQLDHAGKIIEESLTSLGVSV